MARGVFIQPNDLVPGTLPTIHMQDLTRHKPGRLQVNNGLDDIADVPHPPNRMQAPQCLMGFFGMHRRLDNPGTHGIDPNPAFGVLDRQGFGR